MFLAKKKTFQLWLSTDFFVIRTEDGRTGESHLVDEKWLEGQQEEKFTATENFDKFELDGKIAKDFKHKIFPQNFELVLTFLLSPSGQPRLRE